MESLGLSIKGLVSAYPSAVWLLGLGSFINIAGLSFLWPINVIYIHSQLGQPMTIAGLVLMLYSAAGFIGSFIAGWLYDRVGLLPVMVSGIGVAGVVICLPGIVRNFGVYLLVMAVFGMMSSMPFPAMNALAGQVWPEGGRRGFNFLYVANNLGVAVGTATGGVVAAWSFRAVFFSIAVFYGLFMIVVLTLYRKRFGHLHRQQAVPSGTAHLPGHVLPRIPWVAVVVLLLGFVLAWLVYVQWQSTISVFMQQLGFPLPLYSLLWTLNGLLIFAGQPLIGLVTKRMTRLPAQMLLGVLLFAVSFFILSFSTHYGSFVIAMVITTFGEMFVWPAIPAAIAQMAPAGRIGTLQGLANAAAICGRMIGPVVGGFLYDHTTVHAALTLFCALLILPLICFFLYGRMDRSADHPTGLTL